MVNRAFATRYFGEQPAAQRVLLIDGGQAQARIAGVVGNAREFGLDREPVPTVYGCLTVYANPALSFVLRTRGEPSAVADDVRAKLKELEPLRAVHDMVPLAERIGAEYSEDRLRTTLLALFACTALALACLGVYGTLSYVASLRRREVGLRMALGARGGNIVAQFLRQALAIVGIACGAGLVLSLGFSQLLSNMLFGVSPADPIALGAVIALVIVVGTLAALLPAVRAARVDPMQVLREE
jgi:predicted lysophospholipase L1 biosynthesis ABC-type transport system permease subunit